MESVYIDAGRGGYSENVIQVDRGECNVIRTVMQIGHAGDRDGDGVGVGYMEC